MIAGTPISRLILSFTQPDARGLVQCATNKSDLLNDLIQDALAQAIAYTAFEMAERDGSASIQVDGRFVDYPIYRRALRKLELRQIRLEEA